MKDMFRKDKQHAEDSAAQKRRKSLFKTHHCYDKNECPVWIILMLMLSFVFYFTVPADADMVYGTVYEMGSVKANSSFSITNSEGQTVVDNVLTDSNGGYSVFLPKSGRYTVHSNNGRTAAILSQPEPIRQDINFK